MGRTETSRGLAPPAIRKDTRAKQARHIVNKVVPAILASNARAKKGSDGSELIADPEPVSTRPGKETGKARKKDTPGGEEEEDDATKYIKRKGQGRRKAKGRSRTNDNDDEDIQNHEKHQGSKISTNADATTQDTQRPSLKIRILTTDTLTAASTLRAKNRNHPNPCILNMASPLRPGGGVLTGATSQEEFLCARTTLLPSLKESFYRLPEYGGIFTRDVLVFRNHLGLGDAKGEVPATERWWVDVVSAGMLRFPDLEGGEDEEKRLSGKDRRVVEAKMRAVLRIACSRGVRKMVLGAWGCGAYGNPVRDIAEAWRAVLIPCASQGQGDRKKGAQALETWDGMQEIMFAISNKKMAEDFSRAFGGDVEVEAGPGDREDEGEEDETDEVAKELRSKIVEMESQIEKVWNADLKHRMGIILDGLKAQLSEREGEGQDQGSEESDGDVQEYASFDEADSDAAGSSGEEVEVVHYSSDEWQVSPFD